MREEVGSTLIEEVAAKVPKPAPPSKHSRNPRAQTLSHILPLTYMSILVYGSAPPGVDAAKHSLCRQRPKQRFVAKDGLDWNSVCIYSTIRTIAAMYCTCAVPDRQTLAAGGPGAHELATLAPHLYDMPLDPAPSLPQQSGSTSTPNENSAEQRH